MLMKALYVLLALSIMAILGAAVAMLWRLRWHLRRPDVSPPNPLLEVQPEQKPVEKT
jgi:hypothetical protein